MTLFQYHMNKFNIESMLIRYPLPTGVVAPIQQHLCTVCTLQRCNVFVMKRKEVALKHLLSETSVLDLLVLINIIFYLNTVIWLKGIVYHTINRCEWSF